MSNQEPVPLPVSVAPAPGAKPVPGPVTLAPVTVPKAEAVPKAEENAKDGEKSESGSVSKEGSGSKSGSGSESKEGAKSGAGSGATAPKPTPIASVSAPPSVGTENGPIKVEFQALYDNAYVEIKQCFCKGMADLFSEAIIPASDHVYEAINKAIYIDVIDPEEGKIMSQMNPEYENIIGAQVENIMKQVMNNPDPQIKIDIRKNLSGGCQLTREIYEAEENVPITRGIPTAFVGGKNKLRRHTEKPDVFMSGILSEGTGYRRYKNTSRKLTNKKKL